MCATTETIEIDGEEIGGDPCDGRPAGGATTSRIGGGCRSGGGGAVLLSRGPEALYRSVVLPGPARPPRGARRLRPGLRHRPRGRPPRAESARDRRSATGRAKPSERDRGQRAARPYGAPGRL